MERGRGGLLAKGVLAALVTVVLCAVAVVSAPTEALADGSVNVYRLYNEWSGDHFYTTSHDEYMRNGGEGWTLEGVGWTAPSMSGTPVYRLYNRWTGDHHFTTDRNEYETRGREGWTREGVAWYSDDARTLPVYRLYNRFATIGTHHFTTSSSEYDSLPGNGWKQEGVAWYATGGGRPEDPMVQRISKVQGWWWNYSERHNIQGQVETIRSHMVHIVNDKAYLYETTTTIDHANGSTRTSHSGPTSLGTVSAVGVGRNYRITFSSDPKTYLYYWWPGERDHLSTQSDGFMTRTSLVRTSEGDVPQEYLSRAADER